jgi:hypothetical protein
VIVLAAGVSAFLLVHDVEDWTWSLGSSMTVAEADTSFQRSVLPLRFAWNQLAPERRRLEEERRRRAEELEKERLAWEKAEAENAARLAKLAKAAPGRASVATVHDKVATNVEPPPPPQPGPAERLPPMATYALMRLRHKTVRAAFWSLQLHRPAPQPVASKPAPLTAPAAASLAPSPPARSVDAQVSRKQQTRPKPTTARPGAGVAPQDEPEDAAAAARKLLSQPAGQVPQASSSSQSDDDNEPITEPRVQQAQPEPTPAPPAAKVPWWKKVLKHNSHSPRPPGGNDRGTR